MKILFSISFISYDKNGDFYGEYHGLWKFAALRCLVVLSLFPSMVTCSERRGFLPCVQDEFGKAVGRKRSAKGKRERKAAQVGQPFGDCHETESDICQEFVV
jgi:hypothetical protein